MAKPKVVLEQRAYVCAAECMYRDVHYKVGDEVSMSEREAVFLVNLGKFELKKTEKESAPVAAGKADKGVSK